MYHSIKELGRERVLELPPSMDIVQQAARSRREGSGRQGGKLSVLRRAASRTQLVVCVAGGYR